MTIPLNNQVIRFIGRATLGALTSLFLALTFVFILAQLVPGDPATSGLFGGGFTPDIIAERRENYGLNRPLLVRYVDFIWTALQGEFGVSWTYGQSVGALIQAQYLPSVRLAGFSILFAVIMGFILGLLDVFGNSLIRSCAAAGISISLAVPVILSGTLALWLFVVYVPSEQPFVGADYVVQDLLPAFVIGFSACGAIGRTFANGLRTTINAPYVRVATAKGLSPAKVVIKHVMPLTLLPVIDLIVLQAGYIFGGAVITEQIFARPGIGRLFVTAILEKDMPVIQGTIILLVSVYVVLNLLADMFHLMIDPRLRCE